MKRLLPLVVMIGALLAITTTPAEAAQPERITNEVDVTFFSPEGSAACGVPIEISVVGVVNATLFFDDEGNVDRVFERIAVRQTFTNLSTGSMVVAPNVGANVHVDIGAAPDGRNLVKLTGLEGQIIIPGVGSVVQDAGMTLLAGLPGTVPTVLKQNGHFEGGGSPFPGVCQYLP